MRQTFRHTLAWLASASLLAACSGDELLSGAPAIDGTPVQVRVTATMPAPEGDGTRSELNEVENDLGKGILEFKFSDGDRVLVTNARGQSLGILSVPKGKGGKNTAEFTGAVVLPQGSTPIHGIYLGTGRNPSDFATAAVGQDIPLALAEQDGTAASLSRHDLLTAEATATRVGQASNFTLNLQRRMSFAHKRLKFPAGTSLSRVDSVTVSGLSANRQLGMASLDITDGPGEASPITVRFPDGTAVTGHQEAVGGADAYEYIDLYYATCPGQAEVTFSAWVGGVEWKRTAPEFDYRANILYSSAYQRGNTVTLVPQEEPWTVCRTEEELLAALDIHTAGTLNPRVKLVGDDPFTLPESLVGFQSVTIKGDGEKGGDGSYPVTLGGKAHSVAVLSGKVSFTQGTNPVTGESEAQAENAGGQPLYGTQGAFKCYTGHEGDKYAAAAAYQARVTTQEDNTPIYETGQLLSTNGMPGWTTDQSASNGKRYKIKVSGTATKQDGSSVGIDAAFEGSFDIHIGSDSKPDNPVVSYNWTEVDGYVNEYGELTTWAENKPVYEMHQNRMQGTNVRDVNLEFSNLNLDPSAIGWYGSTEEELYRNTASLRISECRLTSPITGPVHHTFVVDNCEVGDAKLRYAGGITIEYPQDVTITNTTFHVSSVNSGAQSCVILVNAVPSLYDGLTGFAYNLSLTFDRCVFRNTSGTAVTQGYAVVMYNNCLRSGDSYHVTFRDCALHGVPSMFTKDSGDNITVTETGTRSGSPSAARRR